MYEKFTKQTAQSIMFSKEEAERLHNNYIGPEHLLLGLLRQDNCDAVECTRSSACQFGSLEIFN